jgi:hypothetical protein
MRTAVITIVSGRRKHLDRQHAGLAASTVRPDLYVVVAMDDPTLAHWEPAGTPAPLIEKLDVDRAALPLAAARNLGAERAIRESAELLIFLDVDCIPSPGLIEHYLDAAKRQPAALLNGAVGYLPEDADYDDPSTWEAAARFHAFRERLPPGHTAAADHRLFWSLCFALRASTWSTIGGFCEDYSGYGGEDTDFGMLAERSHIDSQWVGGAEAYHQFHSTSNPPVQHLDDILANGETFKQRWGFWPMEGWLRDFERLGLVERKPVTDDWVRVGMES